MGNENSVENETHPSTTMADQEKVADETSKTTAVESESENEPQPEEEAESIEEMPDLSTAEAEQESEVNIDDTNVEDKDNNRIEETNVETSMEKSVDTKTEDVKTETTNKSNENSVEENIHRIKTLIQANNGVGLATNLLVASTLSVLVTTPQSETASTEHENDQPDDASQRTSTSTIVTLTEFASKRKKELGTPKTTAKGEKWRSRILKRKEKQKEKAQLQTEAQAEAQAEASQESLQKAPETSSDTSDTVSDCDSSSKSQEEVETKQGETTSLSVQSPGNESELQSNIVQTPENSDSTFTYNCDVDFTLHLVEQQANNPSEALSSISSETQTEFVQLDIKNPDTLGVRWEERPAVQEEIRANPSTSGPSTPTKSGIPNDILKIEDSLNKSFEEAIREFAARNPEGNKLVQMNAANNNNNNNSECPSFVTAGDILDRGFAATADHKTSIRSFVTAPETMRIQEETAIPKHNDSQSASTNNNANANTSTADMILDATDTVKGRLWGMIVDGDDLSAPLSSSPAKDALAEASDETRENNRNDPETPLEQQEESSPELAASISNVKTTTDTNERVSVEAILSHDSSDSSKVDIVIYDQDLLLPEVNLSTDNGYYFLCCWIDSSSSSSSSDPLHKAQKGYCDTSLCLTESTSNSSTKSTSWFFGARSKKEQPWYVMPTFDPDTSSNGDDSSSFCGDNNNNTEQNTSSSSSKDDDDEGHVISRMAILRELDRLKNSDSSLCYSDRVMEMIHFPTAMVPRRNEGVLVCD